MSVRVSLAPWRRAALELPGVTRALFRRTPWLVPHLLGGPAGLVRAQARRHPERPALVGPSRRWTWAELDKAVDRVARFWAARGVAPGQAVAIIAGNRADVIIHPLALARLGAQAALINPQLRGDGLAHVLGAAPVKAVLVDRAQAASLASLGDRLARLAPLGAWCCDGQTPLAGDLRPVLAQTPAAPVHAPLTRPDSPFLYLFTSGTTGLPKAAPITYRRLLLPGVAFQSFAVRARPSDVVFTPLPLYHASAWIVGFATAMVAGCAFGWAARFSASTYWADARAVGATIGLYVGEVCRYLVAQPARPDDAAHGVHTFVGNGLRADVWPAFQARFGGPRIIEFYGATEGNAILINRNGKVGSCGRPVLVGPLDGLRLVRHDPVTEAPVRDAQGRLVACGPGEAGELIARIGALPSERFDGYLDPGATAAKILRDGFKAGDAWFRTGDLLRRDDEGDYFFVDRVGETFRWKGENVSTQAVAAALAGAGGARALVAYGVTVPGQEGRAGMVAVVAPRFDPSAFYRVASAALPPAARPAFVRVVAELPTTTTMKFRTVALKREGFDRCGDDPVFVRDDQAGDYIPLSPLALGALSSGSLRV